MQRGRTQTNGRESEWMRACWVRLLLLGTYAVSAIFVNIVSENKGPQTLVNNGVHNLGECLKLSLKLSVNV